MCQSAEIMSVTQKQIAEKLNISPSLVARALMGHKEVAEKTRLRVENAAREMGYGSGDNRAARMLAAQRYGKRVERGVVGVFWELVDGASPRTMPFFEPILNGYEIEAAKENLDVCLCRTRPDELPRLIRDRSVDGVILMGYSASYAARIQALGLPAVTFHLDCEITPSVVTDDRQGAWQATTHLLELGHRRIAFLGVIHLPGEPCEQRLQGYREAMRAYGIDVPEAWICNSLPAPFKTTDAGAGKNGWEALKAQNADNGVEGEPPFTAVVCYNDDVAMGTVNQINADGWAVPQDVSITGFDDISAEYHFRPAITSVAYPREEMGRIAMGLLCELIRTESLVSPGGNKQQLIATTLSVRDSTAAPRASTNAETKEQEETVPES